MIRTLYAPQILDIYRFMVKGSVSVNEGGPESGAERACVPRHVAIVMDGNGRWAQARHLPRTEGHRKGRMAVRRVVKACVERGVEVLTLFAFSSENWHRPQMEVNLLMQLFLTTLRSEVRRLNANNVRLRFVGDRTAFSSTLQTHIHDAEVQTASNTGLTLVIAANYGGRWDIVQAARKLARAVREERLDPESITAKRFGESLSLNDLPEPDLFIRTGGEQRISNFLLWQVAYTEFFFTPRLWPDYDADALDEAFTSFARRQRRFGLTSEQVERREGA
jgi:undecaprenyl diphosphate synthase